jgi:hypothetical protein
VFVLGVPGVSSVTTSLDFDAIATGGDSLLQGSGLHVQLESSDGQSLHAARIVPNRSGRLAQIRLTVRAGDFSSAENEAFDAVMPTLSRIAFEADTPGDRQDAQEGSGAHLAAPSQPRLHADPGRHRGHRRQIRQRPATAVTVHVEVPSDKAAARPGAAKAEQAPDVSTARSGNARRPMRATEQRSGLSGRLVATSLP